MIPGNTYITLARGFGEYKINNIYHLGEQEDIGGGELLRLSLQKFLAVPVDGYIIAEKQRIENKKQEEKTEETRLTFLYRCLFKKKCQTNFTVKDLFFVWFRIANLNFRDIKLFNLWEMKAVDKEKLPDETIIFRVDQLKMDELSFQLFSNSRVLNEEITVSIYNSTDQPGLAQETARLVRNIGAEVIDVSNKHNQKKESFLYYKNERIRESYTLERLKKTYPVLKVKENKSLEEDISLVLGKDMESFF